MSEKEIEVQTKFHSFLKQRNHKTNAAMQEAQRLVNLYRILNDFGPQFVDEYNVMLKNTSDEVQMALKALVGGAEVRQYLEFLQAEDNQGQEQEENSVNKGQQVGWLPSPEMDSEQTQTDADKGISISVWQEFVQQQEEKLNRIVHELKEEQKETLNRLVSQITSGLQVKKQVPTPTIKPMQNTYSEIIEEKHKETP